MNDQLALIRRLNEPLTSTHEALNMAAAEQVSQAVLQRKLRDKRRQTILRIRRVVRR